MKKFKSDELIDSLQADVKQLLAAAEQMKGMDKIKIAYPLGEGKWTAIQALEHLNMYGRYYLPAIEKAISLNTGGKAAWFNTGRMGGYFTNMMKPKNVYEIKNKMKAPKGYVPAVALNPEMVINEFVEQQQQLLQLLDRARERNLNDIRIPITISKLIKLKLGDTFRFLVAHEQRHMVQARNAIHSLGIATDKFPVLFTTQQLQMAGA
jgi:hypothetical protein